MPCIEQRIPGGVAIYCTSGRGGRRASCSVCPKPHTALCDWPTGTHGKTCDRKLCEQHRARQSGGLDYCPAHAKLAAAAQMVVS